jgi:hypothetical protein
VIRRVHVARVVTTLILIAGCQSIGGRTVLVDFQSAEGIASGQPAYFAGVQVGTTKDPTVVEGRARIPVRLWRRYRDALPVSAVFAVGDDPNQPTSRALLGYPVGTIPRRLENGVEVYQGVSCELELAVLIGAEKARELMNAIQRSPLLQAIPG